jgi:hypothetical protein
VTDTCRERTLRPGRDASGAERVVYVLMRFQLFKRIFKDVFSTTSDASDHGIIAIAIVRAVSMPRKHLS